MNRVQTVKSCFKTEIIFFFVKSGLIVYLSYNAIIFDAITHYNVVMYL